MRAKTPRAPHFEFRINYTRPVDGGTAGGLTFEVAVDELTARYQFAQRFPTGTIEEITCEREVKPIDRY